MHHQGTQEGAVKALEGSCFDTVSVTGAVRVGGRIHSHIHSTHTCPPFPPFFRVAKLPPPPMPPPPPCQGG